MIRIWALMIVMTIHGLAAAQEARPLAENPQAEARLKALAVELRCLVCQNQTLADSNALHLALGKQPAGELVPQALRAVRKGGRVVCAGIHMSDIPSFPYDILWGEREVCSVANLTRRDGEEFLPLAAAIPVATTVHLYPLEQANEALDDLRHGRFNGAAVLVP